MTAVRLAVGEVATRDYLRRELDELRELIEAQQPAVAGRSGSQSSRADNGERADRRTNRAT